LQAASSGVVAGTITLANAATIGADAGAALTLSGSITGGAALTFAGAGTINLTGTLAATIPTGLTKIGNGVLSLQSNLSNATMALTVNAGSAVLSGAGSLGGTGAITVQPGATLALDNSGTNASNRLGGNRPLTLSGNLLLTGSAGATVFSTVTVEAGGAVVPPHPAKARVPTAKIRLFVLSMVFRLHVA
jgi:hypothetical protein